MNTPALLIKQASDAYLSLIVAAMSRTCCREERSAAIQSTSVPLVVDRSLTCWAALIAFWGREMGEWSSKSS